MQSSSYSEPEANYSLASLDAPRAQSPSFIRDRRTLRGANVTELPRLISPKLSPIDVEMLRATERLYLSSGDASILECDLYRRSTPADVAGNGIPLYHTKKDLVMLCIDITDQCGVRAR